MMPKQANRSFTGKTMLILFRIIFTLCLIGTVFFIFSNSFQIGELSSEKSAAVTAFLNKITTKLGFSFTFSEYLVRKLAHFTEYILLGFWLMLTLRVYTYRYLTHISWPLFGGLSTAVLDEALQLAIPGRSGEVRDVLIDFGGVMGGVLCGLFILLLFRAFWDGIQGREI